VSCRPADRDIQGVRYSHLFLIVYGVPERFLVTQNSVVIGTPIIPSFLFIRTTHSYNNTKTLVSNMDTTSEATMPASNVVDSHTIKSLPSTFIYIPNFISEEEETSTLCKIPSNRWTQLQHRRLQTFPTTLTSKNVLLLSPLPTWLSDPFVTRFDALQLFKHTPHKAPNHVLVNEYMPGQGIMPHEDGSAYADVVATISLGSAICLDIYQKQTHDSNEDSIADAANHYQPTSTQTPITRIIQERRSLLITTGDAYKDLLHGISSIKKDTDLGPTTVANWELLGDPKDFESGSFDRKTRVSLTYRDVLKVNYASRAILGMGKK
jgi:alkylated DNA repair dioxygenase AlkB